MDNYEELNTVHLDDLDKLLEECGIRLDYKKKQIKCKFCRKPVTNKNIYSIFKDSGSYKLICDGSECVQALLDLINDRKKKDIQ